MRGIKVVPVGFDPKNPIGSGSFKMTDFKPGEQFMFAPYADYYGGAPYVDSLTVIEFADDTARINALQGGQIRPCPLPKSQAKVIAATSGLALLNAETGAWRPFTMRMDVKPYNDVRVRQAFRLIVDRPQMIEQAYSGLGAVGNDMYARFDPGTPDVPQRVQDLEQAKSLLKQAGYDNNLTVELVTSAEALGGDEVAAAQVFAEQAKAAGVTVNINKTDVGHLLRQGLPVLAVRAGLLGTRGTTSPRPARARCRSAVQRDTLGERRLARHRQEGLRDRRRHRAQRAHRSSNDDGVRHGRPHHLVVAEPGRRILLQDRGGAGRQARLPAGPVRLQERLLRVIGPDEQDRRQAPSSPVPRSRPGRAKAGGRAPRAVAATAATLTRLSVLGRGGLC